MKNFRILLYYKYTTIDDHQRFARQHREFCQSLGLHGRIWIAREGINGTCSGTVEATEAYMEHMKNDPVFSGIEFKVDEADGHAFTKMIVRAKKELVTFRLEDDVDPNQVTGKHLEPREFLEALQDPDTIVIDARNYYEYDLGHFRGAIRPEVNSTREFPDWVRKNLSQYKDKKILTYCTGGIRCEKFSGFLVKEGFKDVGQLHGGIISYGKDEVAKGQLFDGKCYVFDQRISVPVNQVEDVVISECRHCRKQSDRYVNCANIDCHMQFLCCEECEQEHIRSCSAICKTAERHEYKLPRDENGKIILPKFDPAKRVVPEWHDHH